MKVYELMQKLSQMPAGAFVCIAQGEAAYTGPISPELSDEFCKKGESVVYIWAPAPGEHSGSFAPPSGERTPHGDCPQKPTTLHGQ